METPKSPMLASIDVLSELHRDTEKWKAVGKANALLNKEGSDAARADAEGKVFTEVAEIIGDEDFRGAEATIIGLGRTASESALKLRVVKGRYEAVTSLTDPHNGHKQAAVCITTKEDEQHYFLLDDATLAHFEVDMEEDPRPRFIIELAEYARQMKEYLRSDAFQMLSQLEQEQYTRDSLEEMDELLSIHADTETIRIECEKYIEIGTEPHAYATRLRSGPYMFLGGSARFVLSGRTKEPVLELMSPSMHARFQVGMEYVKDVSPIEEFDEMETVGLLGHYFDDDYWAVAHELEEQLARDYGTFGDDTEKWGEIYNEAVATLKSESPSDELLAHVSVLGKMFTSSGDSGYKELLCGSDDVAVIGPDFIEIDGKYKAVLSATMLEDSGDEIPLFIVPHKDYLLRLDSPIVKTERLSGMALHLRREADAARGVVSSDDFYAVSLDEQKELLEVFEENVQDHLATLAELFEDYSVDFRVTEYLSQPESLLELGWGHPLVAGAEASEGDTLEVVADTFECYNPDLNSPGRTEAFSSVDDFVFSEGEPMVVLKSSVTDMYYLVKVRDIIHCAPRLGSDED